LLVIIVRVILLYTLVVIVMRLMGKRQIGELQPFELAVAIMISELAAVPMGDTDIPLLNGIVPIIILLAAQVALSYVSLKSEKGRGMICGTPTVLVEDGKILDLAMAAERYNINDLLEQLRGKGYPNIADVEFAVLETNGQLSVIPKSQKRPVMPADMGLATEYEGLPLTLIIDGNLDHQNLKKAALDTEWLKNTLAAFGITRLEDVLLASLDSSGNLYYQLKDARRLKQ